MTLEDFHTKALCLVNQAEYEDHSKDRVLQDTIISGISSDKIIKEGKDFTFNRMMEIARLEVSTQNHLDQMELFY